MARIVHAATYSFSAPAKGLILDVRLAPAPWEDARPATASLSFAPPPSRRRRLLDAWGNRVDRVLFDRALARLTVSMRIDVGDLPAAHAPDHPPTSADLIAELTATTHPPRADGEGPAASPDDRGKAPPPPRIAALAELAALTRGWRFVPRPDQDAPLAVLERERRGLCLELSRLLVERLRARGIPARHVLGYALNPHDRGRTRERHAWVAFRGCRSWHQMDPVAPDRPPQARLATAWGPDLRSLQPVRAHFAAALVTERAEWTTQIDP